MFIFNKTKIRLRLYISSGVIILLLASTIYFAITRMEVLSQQTVLLHEHPLKVSNSVLKINSTNVKIHKNLKDTLLKKI